MSLSVFDIFKVGIGPSSSHTMGPMRAAREFALGLKRDGLLQGTGQIAVRLYGSLALTGIGHGNRPCRPGRPRGAEPETVDPDAIEPILQRIRSAGRIKLLGEHEIAFDEPMQLLFMRHERLPRHSNGMRFTALSNDLRVLREEDYYSVGAASSCAAMNLKRVRSVRMPLRLIRSHRRRIIGAMPRTRVGAL